MKTIGRVLGLLVLFHTPGAFAQQTGWTWQNPLPQGNTLHAVHFINAASGWAVGEAGTILRSTDGGQTWNPEPSGTTNALLGIDFVDAETGWISGEGGTILRFTGSGTGTAVEDVSDEVPAAFVLAQNYPNPFSTSTTIPFTLDRQSPVRLQIFDGLGRLVAALVDGPHAAGYYTVTWQAGTVPSGVYFYRLQTDRHTEIKKMVLMRR